MLLSGLSKALSALPRARLASQAFKDLDKLSDIRAPVLIFRECSPRTTFKIGVNACALGMALFWANATYVYWPREHLLPARKEGREGWMERIARSKVLPVATTAMALISLIGGALYPLRVVRSLRLLPGDRVELATFPVFGFGPRPRVQVLPLHRISALNSRAAAKNAVHFTVKGHRFPYCVDIAHGAFPNPMHFDFLFAVKR